MPGPSQRRSSPTKPHRYAAVGVALVSSSLLAVTPIAAPLPDVHVLNVRLTDTEVTLDIVRHGEDAGTIVVPFDPLPQGPGLSTDGLTQANDAANNLAATLGTPSGLDLNSDAVPVGNVAGIFSGPDVDSLATAAPFAGLVGMIPTELTGLREVDGGIYAGIETLSPAGILYGISTFFWTIGLGTLMPIPGATDYNGLITVDGMNDAVSTVYSDISGGTASANGEITAALFGSSATTLAWVFNTVKNPDLPVLLQGLLTTNPQGVPQPFPYGGIVEVKGDPTDGWTLTDWAGTDVPDENNMGFIGDVFNLWREVVLPPQEGVWNIYEAVLGGDLTTIETAASDALTSELTALGQLPGLTLSVIQDIPTLFSNIFTFITDVIGGESLTTALEATILSL